MDNPNNANNTNKFLAKTAKKMSETVAMHNLTTNFVQLQVTNRPKPIEKVMDKYKLGR